jgi:hypothetical protein
MPDVLCSRPDPLHQAQRLPDSKQGPTVPSSDTPVRPSRRFNFFTAMQCTTFPSKASNGTHTCRESDEDTVWCKSPKASKWIGFDPMALPSPFVMDAQCQTPSHFKFFFADCSPNREWFLRDQVQATTVARPDSGPLFAEYRRLITGVDEVKRNSEMHLARLFRSISADEPATKHELLSFVGGLQLHARSARYFVIDVDQDATECSTASSDQGQGGVSLWSSGRGFADNWLAQAAVHRDLWDDSYVDPFEVSRRGIQSVVDKLIIGLRDAASPAELAQRLFQSALQLFREAVTGIAVAAAKLKSRRSGAVRPQYIPSTRDLVLSFAVQTGNPPPVVVSLDCAVGWNSRSDNFHGERMKYETLRRRRDRTCVSHGLQHSVLQEDRQASTASHAPPPTCAWLRGCGLHCRRQNRKVARNLSQFWNPC